MERHRTRRLPSILPLALVLGAMGPIVGPVPASANGPLTNDLIVAGTVERGRATRTSAGELDPGSIVNASAEIGATVSLQFFSVGDATVGDSVPVREIAAATTDRAGAYRLAAMPDAQILSEAAGNDGWVNFQLVTTAGADLATEMLPRHWNGAGWDGADRRAFSPSAVHNTLIGVDTVTGARLQSVAPSSAAAPGPCVFVITNTYNNWTSILEFHNQQDADGAWSYGSTADSDIDVGVLHVGQGSWTISGTSHVGTSSGATIGGSTSGNYDRQPITFFHFVQGANSCTGIQQVFANQWLGGLADKADHTSVGCVALPQRNYRLRHDINTFFTRNISRSSTLSGAVQLGFVTLGATSGYSTNVTMSWRWVRNFGYLCGNDNYETLGGILYLT